ncbi:spermidine synthase [Legionella lansingensis]|uniref:Spermidine synthase n=1 Tax=Legionella lansingensis TaxID=45067 RepID=A0A0W0VIK2_9GAMM|nr:spermidine synthase [Legionella lansingensis]SNV48579.1 spermidine synthase [Legionella lansingensis]
MIELLFSISLFLSASLLFVIQPMAAKALLPVYGGTPAVWTICMLFFQSLLLLAYGYAHIVSRVRNTWLWRLFHISLVLITLISLPVVFTPFLKEGLPEVSILESLTLQLGLPLLVIGASAPLLQFAYSQTKEKRAGDPYFLYVASNIGSLLALIAYPWLIERYVGLHMQFYYWTIGYGLYVLLLLGIFFSISYQPHVDAKVAQINLSWLNIFKWVSFSFIPCSLLLGVTFYISADIAATPLLWVVPLALYLLSFIITFAKRPMIPNAWVARHILFFTIFPIVGFILHTNTVPVWQVIFFHLLTFFMLALLCHGRLVARRPPPNQLTLFYFCLALGGVLAGVFNSLLAPRIFIGAYEYPMVLALALLCIPLPKLKGRNYIPFIVLVLLMINYLLPGHGFLLQVKQSHFIEIVALILILLWPGSNITLFASMSILFIFLFSPWFQKTEILTQQRNFYGVKHVSVSAGAHVLTSQNTMHGFQLPGSAGLDGSVAYYGPMMTVVQRLQQAKQPLRATIIGLGTGIMTCQFRREDVVKIIDIDEQVINIATDPRFFTYLRDCPAKPLLIKGDGRLILQNSSDTKVDLLVVDAFSSDAIPTHLLTLEAVKLYQQKITADGVILAHISNRNLNLLPVLTTIARQLDMIILQKQQAENIKERQLASEWVLLTMNEAFAIKLMQQAGWRFVTGMNYHLWTDDYSNLIPLLKW